MRGRSLGSLACFNFAEQFCMINFKSNYYPSISIELKHFGNELNNKSAELDIF